MVVLVVLGVAAWCYKITRPDYRLARGQAMLREGDWDAAEDYARRLEAAGQADYAHLLRGESLALRQSPERALEEVGLIRGEGAVRVKARPIVGKCLVDSGDLRAAYRVFSDVVAEQPENVDAHRWLATFTYDQGQLDAALVHAEKVAQLDPNDAKPHRLMGVIYRDLAQYEPAEQAYRESLRRGPSARARLEVVQELAALLAQRGRHADALALLDAEFTSELPPWAAGTRAECLRAVGRGREAKELLDKTIAVQPAAALYRLRGQLYLDEGKAAEAIPALESAVALAPADRPSHYLLGQAYAAAGRKDDAARELARADELKKDFDRIDALSREAMAKPWDAAVRIQLAETFERMGATQLATMWRNAAAVCLGQKKP